MGVNVRDSSTSGTTLSSSCYPRPRKVIQCATCLAGGTLAEVLLAVALECVTPTETSGVALTTRDAIVLQSYSELHSSFTSQYRHLPKRHFWHPVRLRPFQTCYMGDVELITECAAIEYEMFSNSWAVFSGKECVLCKILQIAVEKDCERPFQDKCVREGVLCPDRWAKGWHLSPA